ncbi:MAG TPA: MopE-related protein, partial [Polyangiales bacterium]
GPAGAPGLQGPAGAPGANGHSSRVRVSTLAPGAVCAQGGLTIKTGLDANDNGTLDDSEVQTTDTLCGASPGCTSGNCGPCVPATCASLGVTSGSVPDGCGGTLNCTPACTPHTCASLGLHYGSAPDGCGGTLTCNDCPPGADCSRCNGSPIACTTIDSCGVDADCNGALAAQPNLQTDVHHCGSCANDCTASAVHAQWSCVAGACVYARCHVGYYDLDGDRRCEYACTFTSPTEVCNGIDDNCDGQVDENCINPGVVAGCTPQAEACDGLDNNCDGIIDNQISPTPCEGTNPAGTNYGPYSQCKRGMTACEAAQTRCLGEVGPSVEVCDGVDNDCDGQVDEQASGVGAPCGDGVSCGVGAIACVNGALLCVGSISIPH